MSNNTEENKQEDPKLRLYMDQKKLLNKFLERGAISKAQYDKSLGDLTVKMGISDNKTASVESHLEN